ncbi:MAG TPA: substrate-binding domain-containing protein, partial [Rectinemataceae bacterium]|nr:substrate-binding domain-containing protein [Rectinemataceae bacterium]
MEDFLLTQVDLPLVTFGLKIGEKPVVNIDVYSGMKQLIFHLIRRHKCRKIAFLCGPREHSSAEDRFRAYRDALEESGIRFDESLVSFDNSWTEGKKAMQTLLDEANLKPGDDFDALCAASDLLVFEAAKLLRERGHRIPADVALGGFNDSDESNLFSPTYTTVHMPFDRQAVQAFRMLLDLLEGKNPADKVLKTKLIIRQSCGCLTESVHRAGMVSSSAWKRLSRASADPSVAEVLRFVSDVTGFAPEETDKYLEPIVSSFLHCLAKRGDGKNFFDALDSILNEFIFQDRDIAVFQDIVSAIRTACREYAEFRSSATAFETLLGQGRVLISDAEKRMSNFRVWKEKSVDHWLNILNHELLCAK